MRYLISEDGVTLSSILGFLGGLYYNIWLFFGGIIIMYYNNDDGEYFFLLVEKKKKKWDIPQSSSTKYIDTQTQP